MMKEQMKEDLTEESVLVGSSIKWVALSTAAGTVIGTATAAFLNLLQIGTRFYQKGNYFYFLLPVTLFLSGLIMSKVTGDGCNLIRSIHDRSGRVDLKYISIGLAATLITLISGGSAGKEGPCGQLGAGIASSIADIFKFKDIDRKRFVVCGFSAGVAGVFGTPIAGAIFASEVIYVDRFSYIVFLPSLIASFVSYNVNKFFGIVHPIHYIKYTQGGSAEGFLSMIFFGVFIGIVSMLFIRMMNSIKYYFKKINIYAPLRGIIGGLILIAVVLITGSKDYLGLGTDVIENAVSGAKVQAFGFLAKMFTTSVTFGSGGNGGILTPIFFIGTAAGNAWAQLVHGNLAFYSAAGMAACFGACANTPITAIIMSMELYGTGIAPYVSIACAVSYIVVGHRSVYPSQILFAGKTPSLDIETNCEVGKIRKFKLKRDFNFMVHKQ